MSKDEIIDGLKAIDSICGQSMDESSSWIGEVLHGAVRLLEQEPSGDLISREETLNAFADYVGSGMSMNDYDALWNIVEKMPPKDSE